MINYNNRKFRVLQSSSNGEVSSDMIFHYKQDGEILTCEYSDNNILKGILLGLVAEDGTINMSYHQIHRDKSFSSGVCVSRSEILANGKIKLYESWNWTTGDCSKGESILIEI